MKSFYHFQPFKRIISFCLQTILIYGSILTASWLWAYYRKERPEFSFQLLLLLKVLLLTGIYQMFLPWCKIYEFKFSRNYRELSYRLMRAFNFTCLVLGMIYVLNPRLLVVENNFILNVGIVVIPTICLWVFYGLLFSRRRMNERVLVLGTGKTGRMIMREIFEDSSSDYEIAGFLSNPGGDPSLMYGYPMLGSYSDLAQVVQGHSINRVVLSLNERRNKLPLEDLLEAKFSGVKVEEGAQFYELVAGKIPLHDLRPSDLIFSDGFRKSRVTIISKRLMEILVSLLILIITFPVLLLVSILIKIESRGPVLFKQKRVGNNGRMFNLYKLRSMVHDAEKHTGPVWAESGDSRVTRLGRILRKTRIDEIPQVLSVIKGNMSFVGPRPERLHFTEFLKREIPFYFQRLSVKPGITGLAQIKYPYGSSVEDAVEKLQYDLYYIKHMSFWLDLAIILDTIKVVLSGKGGR